MKKYEDAETGVHIYRDCDLVKDRDDHNAFYFDEIKAAYALIQQYEQDNQRQPGVWYDPKTHPPRAGDVAQVATAGHVVTVAKFDGERWDDDADPDLYLLVTND